MTLHLYSLFSILHSGFSFFFYELRRYFLLFSFAVIKSMSSCISFAPGVTPVPCSNSINIYSLRPRPLCPGSNDILEWDTKS